MTGRSWLREAFGTVCLNRDASLVERDTTAETGGGSASSLVMRRKKYSEKKNRSGGSHLDICTDSYFHIKTLFFHIYVFMNITDFIVKNARRKLVLELFYLICKVRIQCEKGVDEKY